MHKNIWFLRNFVVVMLLAVFALLCLSPTSKAHACTQPPGGHIRYSIEERVDQALIVAEGLVIDLYGESYEHIAIIEVTAYYKGGGPTIISVAGFGDGAMCRSYIQQGQHQIFYLRQNADGSLWASYGSVSDAYITASDDNRTAIVNHTGQSPVPPVPDAEPNLINLNTAQAQATNVVIQRETNIARLSQTPPSPTYTPTPNLNPQTATAFKGTFDANFSQWLTLNAIPGDHPSATPRGNIFRDTFRTATAFAHDFATSQARDRFLTTTPTPPYNIEDVYGPGGATAIVPSFTPTTPPAVTLTPSPSFFPPLDGSTLATASVDQFQTIMALSHTPSPLPLDFVPPSTSVTPASLSPSLTPTLVPTGTINQFSESDGDDENSDWTMFLLGFLSATALFSVFALGYWLGRGNNPRKSNSQKGSN